MTAADPARQAALPSCVRSRMTCRSCSTRSVGDLDARGDRLRLDANGLDRFGWPVEAVDDARVLLVGAAEATRDLARLLDECHQVVATIGERFDAIDQIQVSPMGTGSTTGRSSSRPGVGEGELRVIAQGCVHPLITCVKMEDMANTVDEHPSDPRPLPAEPTADELRNAALWALANRPADDDPGVVSSVQRSAPRLAEAHRKATNGHGD